MTAARLRPTARLPLGLDYCRRVAFPQVVQNHRESCGLSRAAVAEVTGMTPQAITDIETGVRLPTLEVLFALADVLGTDAAELLHETRARAQDMVVNQWRSHRAPGHSTASAFSTGVQRTGRHARTVERQF